MRILMGKVSRDRYFTPAVVGRSWWSLGADVGPPGAADSRMSAPIAQARLRNQSIGEPRLRDAADVVSWLGAVQAQEYEPAKWGLGLRIPGSVEPEIERAFEAGRILRTHVMRPTWHFVTPADIRWLLELTGPRVLRMMRGHDRLLELDAKTIARGNHCHRAGVERATVSDPPRDRRPAQTCPADDDRRAAREPGDARRARRTDLQRSAPRQAVHLRADRRTGAERPATVARRGARRTEPPLLSESRSRHAA